MLELQAVAGKNPENKMPDKNERRLLNTLLCNMKKLVAILALTVSCSVLTPVSVVTEAPDNCISKGLVITSVFDGARSSEYVSDLKNDVRNLGANTLHCCWIKDFNDPSVEEEAVAYNPKSGRSEPALEGVGEAFYCEK